MHHLAALYERATVMWCLMSVNLFQKENVCLPRGNFHCSKFALPLLGRQNCESHFSLILVSVMSFSWENR